MKIYWPIILPILCGIPIVYFLIWFFIKFLLPSRALKKLLCGMLVKVKECDNINSLDEIFKSHKRINHLWIEYKESLHYEEVGQDPDGNKKYQYRATISADNYFNTQYIVDSYLQSEFFKHLPGILTGIGIIGTFFGLIIGLLGFTNFEDAAGAQIAITRLLHGVLEAFFVSASAISAAMVITWYEKRKYSQLSSIIEDLAFAIDHMVQAGANEEYLQRLVIASETSATQNLQLKDALVNDLKAILENVANRQIEATLSVGKTFEKPLADMASAVGNVSREQGNAVHSLLEDVLVSFAAKLEGLLGEQIGGITQMQQEVVRAMSTASATIEKMVSNIGASGKSATEEIVNKMNEALGAMENRQANMNDQMIIFVSDLKSLLVDSQKATGLEIQKNIISLKEGIENIIGNMHQITGKMIEAGTDRETRLQASTENVINQLSNITSSISESVNSLSNTTLTSIEKMNLGADKLSRCINELSNASEGINAVFKEVKGLSDVLNSSSMMINSATASLETVIIDGKKSRDSFAEMTKELTKIIDLARREASLTEDVLQRIEHAAANLKEAQDKTDNYFESLVIKLAETQNKFGEAVVRTTSDITNAWHQELTKATALLSQAVIEVGSTLDEWTDTILSAKVKAS